MILTDICYIFLCQSRKSYQMHTNTSSSNDTFLANFSIRQKELKQLDVEHHNKLILISEFQYSQICVCTLGVWSICRAGIIYKKFNIDIRL